VKAADLTEHTINTVADTQECFLWFEVDVGSTALYCVGEQCIDESDHRMAVAFVICIETVEIQFAGFNFVQDAIYGKFEAIAAFNVANDGLFAREHR